LEYCTKHVIFVPMKSIFPSISVLLAFFVLISCSETKLRVAEGLPYTLSGVLWQDSTTTDSLVTLIVDRHEISFSAEGDSVPVYEELQLPVVNGLFSYKGMSPIDADELYLYDQHGHVARLYGTSGAELKVEVLKDGTVRQSMNDTTDLMRALVLRDSIPLLKDSLRIRRILGGLPESAKPEWLMNSINTMLDQMSHQVGKSTRLPRVDLQLSDTIYSLLSNRQEYLMLYFWAEDVPSSVDSLHLFSAIARDYGLYSFADSFAKEKSKTRREKAHRIELISVCMQASDSTSWKKIIKNLPGKHTILQGGYAHPLATVCRIHQLPSLVIVDRFGNYQVRDVWNKELYKWLDRAPFNSDINKKLK